MLLPFGGRDSIKASTRACQQLKTHGNDIWQRQHLCRRISCHMLDWTVPMLSRISEIFVESGIFLVYNPNLFSFRIQYIIIIYCFYLFKHSQSKLHAQTLYYHHVVQQNSDIFGLTYSYLGLTKTVTRDKERRGANIRQTLFACQYWATIVNPTETT